MAEKWFGPVPYDPSKHSPVELEGGMKMTERLATEVSADGQVFNHPTLWFTQDGEPLDLTSQDAREVATSLAMQYEAATGKRFPRFGKAFDQDGVKLMQNFELGARTARARSDKGGATRRSLINTPGTE
jgi:hypothetical protein